MPMNAQNQRGFERKLFAGMLETITLFKRGDDQREGTVKALTVFNARRGKIYKSGEPLRGDMATGHGATWHIPRPELDRVGVAYLNNLDRIVDKQGRTWQVESPSPIEVKLFQVHVDLHCVLANPDPKDGS